MKFDMEHIRTNAAAQLGRCVCDGNQDAVVADSVLDRKAIRVRTAVRGRAKVNEERVAKLVRETRIRGTAGAELRCTTGDLVCDDAGRSGFSAFLARRQNESENRYECENNTSMKHLLNSRSR